MGKYSGFSKTGDDIADVSSNISNLMISIGNSVDVAGTQKLLKSLGKAFGSLDNKTIKDIFKNIPDKAGGDILNAIPSKNAVSILKKLDNATSAKMLGKIKNVEAENLLKRLPSDQATDIAKKMGKTWNIDTKTLLVGGTVLGVGVYLDKKIKESKEKTEACTNTCLPSNWAEYEYGDLDKSKLKFSETKSTNVQPICKINITDCRDYCSNTCTKIHEYELPGSDVVEEVTEEVTDKATGGLRMFFETINPFNPNGIFGDTGWISVVSCALMIISFIILSTIKK